MRLRTDVVMLGVGLALGLGLNCLSKALADPTEKTSAESEYASRVVAYIHETIPITRQELGEYLIARYGTEKMELLINKRIIELACQEQGITVAEVEVAAALEEDCKGLGVQRDDFIRNVLKHYNKTLYEWREDVIKPRLLLGKLCQGRIKIEDADLRKEFESRYGPKVDCRLILIPRGEERHALALYEKVRGSEEEFDRAARSQANSTLAASGGRIKPICHYTGSEAVEKAAFALQPGEVSSLIETSDGLAILKCMAHLPPDGSKKFESEKAALEKDVRDKKITQEIPKLFKELREKAAPKWIIKKPETDEELKREVKKELPVEGVKPKPAAN
jgi:hypothetical protein